LSAGLSTKVIPSASTWFARTRLPARDQQKNSVRLPTPIEKKLIGWSLGLGIVLLVVLIALNHFVPIKI
jgi:hypothetical protein